MKLFIALDLSGFQVMQAIYSPGSVMLSGNEAIYGSGCVRWRLFIALALSGSQVMEAIYSSGFSWTSRIMGAHVIVLYSLRYEVVAI